MNFETVHLGPDVTLYRGDCLGVLRATADSSIGLIATDPPYFKVKGEAWDRQWDNPEAFISWLGEYCEQWRRVLKPSGSLYCFASPKMAARVEVEIGRWFNVLNRIRWTKEAGWHNKNKKEELRSFLSPWEECIFAEHYGADNIAKGEAGYGAKCDELRGFVFEPLRAYLAGERDRARIQDKDAREKMGLSIKGGGLLCHFWNRAQWMLPTQEQYTKLQQAFPGYFTRPHEDLRADYEDLRRPFNVTPDVPYTDVWTFPTVQAYPGKHPCEKPLKMMEHIITVSSREGDVVFDGFMGGGTTGVACVKTGCRFIGAEIEQGSFDIAVRRISEAQRQGRLFA